MTDIRTPDDDWRLIEQHPVGVTDVVVFGTLAAMIVVLTLAAVVMLVTEVCA